MSVTLVSPDPGNEIDIVAERWEAETLIERMWQADPTVWAAPGTPEVENRLGWLSLHETSLPLVPVIDDLRTQAVAQGITDIVLCGMGGSSLAPEVFASSIRSGPSDPRLTVLDSTHPDAVASVAANTSASTTWYVIASKSGTTLETLSFFRYFWKVASESIEHPGSHFLAITDPGSALAALAVDRGFRACIEADPTVGGRYSALTAFGLVPAGLVGADVGRLLTSAAAVAGECSSDVPLRENPAFILGATLAVRALSGIDKVHLISSGPIAAFPVWAEQLIAESTGKNGRGIVPIASGPFPSNASDGTVVSIGQSSIVDADMNIIIDDSYDVAGVMFLFELATAIAGKILGIQPFDQPDVQLAKQLTASAMAGELASDTGPPMNIHDEALPGTLAQVFGARDISYVSIQAYVDPGSEIETEIERLRSTIDRRYGVYTTSGYGPRFLHSTGQIHKGGPPGGVYVQIIDTPHATVAIPETDDTFNRLISAQALGDRAALEERGRAVVSIAVGSKTAENVGALVDLLVPPTS